MNSVKSRRFLASFATAITMLSITRTITGNGDLTSSVTIAQALVFASPIALAGLAGIWSERAGVVNIGLEGMMILGTFGAGWAGWQWGAWAGVLAGVIFGAVGGLLLAVAAVTFGVDQIIAGTAVNLLALGLTKFLAILLFTNAPGGGQAQSPPIKGEIPTFTLNSIVDPLTSIHEKGIFFISDAAGLIGGLFLHLSILTIITFLLFVMTSIVLWKTAFGLRLRSAGENPWAADSLGVKVVRYKYLAVVFSGFLAGLGGAYLSISSTIYRNGNTAGRGFIGLATMIFGNWRPGGTGAGALMFGYIDTLRLIDTGNKNVKGLILLGALVLFTIGGLMMRSGKRNTAIGFLVLGAVMVGAFFGATSFPPEVAQVAPYITTLLVLATASQNLRPPAADGVPYRKGDHH
ncbi:MAG: ABC transporter permease [Actinomycetes bacterium]